MRRIDPIVQKYHIMYRASYERCIIENNTSTLTTTVIYLNGINVRNVLHM